MRLVRALALDADRVALLASDELGGHVAADDEGARVGVREVLRARVRERLVAAPEPLSNDDPEARR